MKAYHSQLWKSRMRIVHDECPRIVLQKMTKAESSVTMDYEKST
jgi:hypothetical protein